MDILGWLIFNVIIIVTSWHLGLVDVETRLIKKTGIVLIINKLGLILLVLVVKLLAPVKCHDHGPLRVIFLAFFLVCNGPALLVNLRLEIIDLSILLSLLSSKLLFALDLLAISMETLGGRVISFGTVRPLHLLFFCLDINHAYGGVDLAHYQVYLIITSKCRIVVLIILHLFHVNCLSILNNQLLDCDGRGS
jgi:hypothetical protein